MIHMLLVVSFFSAGSVRERVSSLEEYRRGSEISDQARKAELKEINGKLDRLLVAQEVTSRLEVRLFKIEGRVEALDAWKWQATGVIILALLIWQWLVRQPWMSTTLGRKRNGEE
jgi:hypothetical protein